DRRRTTTRARSAFPGRHFRCRVVGQCELRPQLRDLVAEGGDQFLLGPLAHVRRADGVHRPVIRIFYVGLAEDAWFHTGRRVTQRLGPMSPESDKQLKFWCAGQGVEAKALQEGGYHFSFFQTYNSRRTVTPRPCGTVARILEFGHRDLCSVARSL